MKKTLKSDRTLLLTSILLFLMLAAGIASGVIGFISGHTALKGVTQPDIRPNNSKGGIQQNLNTKGLELLQEGELIASVKKQMGVESPKADSKQAQIAKQEAKVFEKLVKNDPKAGIPIVKLPVVREDQGILLGVKSMKQEANSVKMEVTLSNMGSQPVNFGQGTIAVLSDKSQSINSTTTGLPNNLPANGKAIKVMLTIPKANLDQVKSVSLQLTDIDKKLQLEVAGIPVK